MAVALTSVKVYPLETEQSMRDNFPHLAEISLTALASDTTVNLATLAAADSTNGPYLTTLLQRADVITGYFFLESARAQNGAAANVKTFLSNASAGGAAAEAYTVTGLLSTDTVIAVTPQTATTNAAYIRSFGTLVTNGLTVTYNTDPGASGKVQVSVIRTGGVATGSDHVFSGTANAPVFTFAGGTSTPTVLTLVLGVKIKKDYPPVKSPSAG